MDYSSNTNTLASNLDSLLKEDRANDIKARDRSDLNLPSTQQCDTCEQTKPHVSFNLKKRNQSTSHLPPELESTCKECKKTGKKIGRGLFVKAVRSGDLMLSDAAIKALRDNNGQKQKELIDSLIGMAISRDIDAMKILVNLVQGRAGVIKPESPVNPDALSPDEETSSEDLLKKLESNE